MRSAFCSFAARSGKISFPASTDVCSWGAVATPKYQPPATATVPSTTRMTSVRGLMPTSSRPRPRATAVAHDAEDDGQHGQHRRYHQDVEHAQLVLQR